MHLSNLFSFIKKRVPENFFTWIAHFYKIKGLSPPKKPFAKVLYLALAIPHIFMCTFLLIFFEWSAFFFASQTFKERMFNMSIATLDTILVFRTVVWVFSRDKLGQINNVVTRKSFNFSLFDIAKVNYVNLSDDGRQLQGQKSRDFGKIWGKAEYVFHKNGNELESFCIQRMFYTRLICCCLHIAITIISVLTYVVSFITEVSNTTYEAFNPRFNRTSTYRKMEYPLYLPVDTSFDGYYWVVFYYNCYAHIGNMITFLPIETTLTCSLIHLISQTTVVKEAFKYIDKNISPDQSSRGVDLIKEIRIVKCINELQEIYRAVQWLEELYNIQLMIQYGFATFLLCSICYVLPLVENTMETTCRLIFLAASLGQIFIFSYCCQTLAYEDVGVSVYNIDWPNYPPKLKSTLNILIRKTQKPAHLTAGKIVVIDLFFFIQVIQKSYSFYTLIINTN